MFAQFPKKTLFSKIISGIVTVSFILTSVPVRSYAALGTADKLRTEGIRDQKNLEEFTGEVKRITGKSEVVPLIALAAENVSIGGEDEKTIDQHTGRVLTLERLKELKLLTAILGHSATRNDFVGVSSEGTEFSLKELARPKVDPFVFGPERKGTQGKNAIISAFNQVCERYSYELKKKLVMDVKVEPYVIAAAEEKMSEAKKGGETLDSAEAFFKYLGHFLAREIEAKQFDKILNDRILRQLKDKEVQTITLCVGSENKGLPVEAEILAVKKQLDIDFNGVGAENLVSKEFLLAFEPTSKIGTGTAADPDYIRQVHQAIFDWLEAKYGKEIAKNVWGKSFFCLYGGSANDKSIAGIMAVKSTRPDMQNVQLVHGVLFATYGQQVSGFLNIAKAVNEAAVRDNAHYVCFVNLKSFRKEKRTPREEYLNKIYAAIKRGEVDPVKTKLIIADQDTYLEGWKDLLNTVHSQFVGATAEKVTAPKAEVAPDSNVAKTSTVFWLSELYYPAKVDAKQTEVIDNGYAKETLTYETKAGESIHSKLESLFKDKHKDGDVYVFLKKDGKIFALGKENKKDHTLATVSTAELSDIRVKTEYYSMLLEFVSKITEKTGEFIELVEQDGERLKRFISRGSKDDKDLSLEPVVEKEFSLGDRIKGIKYWFGNQPNLSQKFFQMEFRSIDASPLSRPTLITFKPSPRLNGRGLSLIVQPKVRVGINGAGTVGYRVAEALRRSGLFLQGITVGKLNEKARDAALREGYNLYFYNPKESEKFVKADIRVAGMLEDLLRNADFVIDGSPEEGAANKEIYAKFPVKVIYQGGEDADIAKNSFASSTNYEENIGQSETRVVSCNTTGLSRTAAQTAKVFNGQGTTVYLMRRSTDAPQSKGGLTDAVVGGIEVSHHADDLRTVLPKGILANIKTLESFAFKIPTTHFHVHIVDLEAPGLTAEKVKQILKAQSRVGLVDFKKEFDTATIFGLFNNLLKVTDPLIVTATVIPDNAASPGKVRMFLAVPQESIVVPENVNAVQAMFVLSKDADAAIRLVDEAMGINNIKIGLETIAPAKLAKKPSVPKAEIKIPAIPGVITYTNKQLEDFKSPAGKPVYVTLNGDIGDIEGNKVVDKQAKKLEEGFDNLELLTSKFDAGEGEVVLKNALYLLIHNGRPGGKYVKRLSAYRIVEWYANRRAKDYGQGIEGLRNSKGSKKIKEDSEGRVLEPVYWTVKNYRGRGDVKVWFLPDVDEQSIREGGEVLKKLNPGDWAIAEDRRMDSREQAGEPSDTPGADPRASENVKLRDEAMKDMLYRGGRELLVGPIGFNFGRADLHRWDARITSAGKFLLMVLGQNIAEFNEMIKGIRTLIDNAHKRGSVALIVSGVKKDKIDLGVNEIKNKVLIKGDQLKILGATAIYPLIADGLVDKEAVQLLIDKGIIEQEALDSYYELKKAAAEEGIKIWYPKNLKLVKLIDEKELKEGEDLLPASIQKAKEEDILVINDGRVPKGYVIADVDNQALNEISNDLEDENVRLIFQSGPVGPFDLNALFAKGSDRFQQKLKELSAKKMVICFGSDTEKANKNAKVEGIPGINEDTGTGMNRYTEGGAGLAALALREGEDLPAIEAAKESAKIHVGEEKITAPVTPVDLPSAIQNIINQIKAKFNIPEVDIRKFFATVQLIHNAWGGPQFGNFVDTLAKTQQPAQDVRGELKISAEKKFKENGDIVANIVLEVGNIKLEKEIWTGNLHSEVSAIDRSKDAQDFIVSEINERIAGILKEGKFDIRKTEDFYAFKTKIENMYEGNAEKEVLSAGTLVWTIADIIKGELSNLRERLLTNRHVIIVSPEFFKLLDAIPTLLKAIKLSGDNFQFVLYGKGADNFRDLLGGTENKNIIVADTLTGAISGLDVLPPGNILALVSSAEAKEYTDTPKVKQLVFSENSVSTDVMTMGITTVLNTSEANNASEEFYAEIGNKGVISQEASATVIQDRREIKSKLDQMASVELPDMQLAPETKSIVTEAETSEISKFIAEISG